VNTLLTSCPQTVKDDMKRIRANAVPQFLDLEARVDDDEGEEDEDEEDMGASTLL